MDVDSVKEQADELSEKEETEDEGVSLSDNSEDFEDDLPELADEAELDSEADKVPDS